MKWTTALRAFGTSCLSISSLLVMSQSQPATDNMAGETPKQQLEQFQRLSSRESLNSRTVIKNAKVSIKLEAHGSIRAKVYLKGVPQYEYILDRVRPQSFLTKSIVNANVNIIRNEKMEEGLAIHDLTTNRRYVLYTCFSPRVARAKHGDGTVFIQGYAGVLQTISAVQELGYVLNKETSEKK